MTTMPALSLRQPWASLLFTRQPGWFCDDDCPFEESWCVERALGPLCAPRAPMVKRIETRSWPCPEKYWGQRMAFASTKRKPPIGFARDFPPMELNRADLPLGCIVGSGIVTTCLPITGEHGRPLPQPRVERTDQDLLHVVRSDGWTDASDQLPYGDFTPGRWAWIIEDAEPCDPIPVPPGNHSRIWRYTPEELKELR